MEKMDEERGLEVSFQLVTGAKRAVNMESVAAVYMGYLAWMAVRFGEVPRIIGFAMLSVVLAVDAMVRRRRISDK